MTFSEMAVTYLPSLLLSILWLVGIVVAAYIIRRGGGKAEKLLLTGFSLLFITTIATPVLQEPVMLAVAKHGMTAGFMMAFMVLALPVIILNMIGIVCLIIAIWMRWRTTNAKT